MTRIATKLTEGVFTNPPSAWLVAGIRLPQRSHVVGEYVLGGSEAESIKNRAVPSNPLTVQGTGHVYNANSVTVRPSLTTGYGFLTGILPDENFTLIVVRKNPTAGGTTNFPVGMIAGSSNWGPKQFGANNYFPMGESGNTGGALRPKPVGTGFYFEAGVQAIFNAQLSTGGKSTLYWYDTGAQQSAVSSTSTITVAMRRSSVNARIAIGSNTLSDSVTTNTIEIAYVAIINRPLTAAEIDTAYQAIVAYYASRGVTVT